MGKMEAKYTRVYETLKRDILSGKYSSRNPFPSVAMIIRRFAISNLTAVKVLEKLKNDGLVKSYQGRGTFVTNTATSRKIGLIVPGVAYTDFFQPILSEINTLAQQRDYLLILVEMFSKDRVIRFRQVHELVEKLVQNNVAGVVYQPLAEPEGSEINAVILRILKKSRVPVVLFDSDIVPFPMRSDYDVVGINDVAAGARIANHLISVGARKIHFLAGELMPNTFRNRIYGAKTAILETGRGHSIYVLRAEADDVKALERHIKRYGKPDAFMCCNDLIAAIFERTLEAVGLKVPRDVMLTGFADLPVAALMTPRLTTIRQSLDQMGVALFNRLMARIENPMLPATEILFSAPLVVRESTQKIGKRKSER